MRKCKTFLLLTSSSSCCCCCLFFCFQISFFISRCFCFRSSTVSVHNRSTTVGCCRFSISVSRRSRRSSSPFSNAICLRLFSCATRSCIIDYIPVRYFRGVAERAGCSSRSSRRVLFSGLVWRCSINPGSYQMMAVQ